MEHPEDYVDSAKYFSWERYFTALLMQLSGTEDYKKYRKEKLALYYLQDSCVQKIKAEMLPVEF